MTSPRIEQVWQELGPGHSGDRQKLIASEHPFDIYAEVSPPDRVGLVVLCATRPQNIPRLRALEVEVRTRQDGCWSLRIALREMQLRPVFAALCDDIVISTWSGVSEANLAATILARIERWRSLLERGKSGLEEVTLRGLVGELLVLDKLVLEQWSPLEAIEAWRGPLGAPQDFLLPDSSRIEVKTASRSGRTVQIHGLEQLDAGSDPLVLAVVRVERSGVDAVDTVTPSSLIDQIRARLLNSADAVELFHRRLADLGWHEHPLHSQYSVRPIAIELSHVSATFPRLTVASVPVGIVSADYTIALPDGARTAWTLRHD